MSIRQRCKDARSYAVYYGHGETERLSQFEAVVVEPKGQTKDGIERLKSSGVLALAYMSVMEIPSFDPQYALLADEDFILRDGARLGNPAFGTELVSLRSKRWLGLLHHRAGSLMMREGYDGVFLDTIGNAEWEALGTQSEAECQAAVGFVRGLRRCFPERAIVQNNGLSSLIFETAPLVDAVCWENPPIERKDSRKWVELVADRLRRLGQQHGLATWVLKEAAAGSEEAFRAVEAWSAERGFLLYKAPTNYLSV